MKSLRNGIASLVLTFVMLALSSPCFALMGISQVSRERAREMGMELRVTKNGPVESWVELEFKADGELKNFDHVSVEITDGEKFLLGWTALKEKRTNSGSVVVSFLANRAYLDKVTLRVVVAAPTPGLGGRMEMDGFDLRLRDFLEPASAVENSTDKAAAGAPKATDAAVSESPRKVVGEFLRRIKAESENQNGDPKQVWDLTTRSTNASWGSDLTTLAQLGLIHPLHQLGNDAQTMVLSAPFTHQGRERVFSAILFRRDGKWLIDRHDAHRSPAEARSLMEGYLLNSGVKFDVQAAELVGKWSFPCASTLTLFADGKGVRVYEGPSGVPEKSERFNWDVSGSNFRVQWPDHADTAMISWVTDDAFRTVNAKGQDSYFDYREAAIAAGAPREFILYDPRITEQQAHCFGIDADRQRIMDERLTPKLDIADPHQTDVSLIEWATEHRMDAVGRVILAEGKVAQLGLRTFQMLTIPTTAEAWEKATPAQIAEQIHARLADWSFLGRVNDVLTDGKATATFAFQTREGSQGLLQIVGPAGKNGVKIRYKVLKEAEDISPAAAKGAPPAKAD